MRKKTAIFLVTALVIVGLLGFGAWKGYEWFITRTTPNACYLQVAGVEEPLRLTNEQANEISFRRKSSPCSAKYSSRLISHSFRK